MSDPLEAKNSPEAAAEPTVNSELDTLRTILLEEERQRIHQLEQSSVALQAEARSQTDEFSAQIDALQAEIAALRQTNEQQQAETAVLEAKLNQLQAQFEAESRSLIPRLIQQMGHIISNTIRDKRDELAEALGPIMSDAIRVQIRDSRKEMVEALYPIILETVMRAVAEFLREFQRNIDARLKSTFNMRGVVNRFWARLRGVSPADLTLRESFTFSLEELFLIQHESGLLVAHHSPSNEVSEDSDLIGGMLTAIRDFARDSFGEGEDDQELREVEFGDERIIIQSGQYIYAAAVIKGIEPTGFHARLRELVSELHIQHKPALRDFAGDPAALPDLTPLLEAFDPQNPQAGPMPRNQRLFILGGAGLLLLFTAVACFYLQFTIALWPLAFGAPPTATTTPTLPPTATVQPTLEPSATVQPSPTATETPLPTSTATAVPPSQTPPPPTNTNTPLPSATAPPSPVTIDPVWVRTIPNLDGPQVAVLPQNTAVTVLAQTGEWVEVAWQAADGQQRGWIGVRWLVVDGIPFAEWATPVGR